MKIRAEKVVDVQEWNKLVTATYGKPYHFQQQDGCRDRSVATLTIPEEAADFSNTTVPEVINCDELGVSFAAWLARDPAQPVGKVTDEWRIKLWWHRNFYPDIQMVANDLHAKGLVEAGSYLIIIDW